MNLLGLQARGKQAVKYMAVLHQGEMLIDGMFDGTLPPKTCEENIAQLANQILIDGKLYTSMFSETSWSYQSIGDEIKLVVVTHPRLSQRHRLALISQLVSYLQEYQQYYARTKRDDIMDDLKPEMYKVVQRLNKSTNLDELEQLDIALKKETTRQERFKDEDYNPKDKQQPVKLAVPEQTAPAEPENTLIVVPRPGMLETVEPKYVLQNDLKDDAKKDKPKKKGFFKSLFGM